MCTVGDCVVRNNARVRYSRADVSIEQDELEPSEMSLEKRRYRDETGENLFR